jgi:hypothetical protein
MTTTTGSAVPLHSTARSGGTVPCAMSRRAALAGAVAGLAACSAQPGSLAIDGGAPRAEAVHLVARGWHTDVDLPARRLPAPLITLEQDFPGASHFLFGFGERAYWAKPDPDSLDTFAALVPARGVILVTALRVSPEVAFPAPQVVTLPITTGGMARLATFLAGELTEGGEVRRLAQGPYIGSRFYATSRRYSAAYTCNTWTADALQAAGTGVAAHGVIFAGQVIERAREAVDRIGDGAGAYPARPATGTIPAAARPEAEPSAD